MILKAQLLYELGQMKEAFSWFSSQNDDEMQYLFVIKAAGDGEQTDDWTGKMNETKRAIMTVGADIKKEITANTDAINKMVVEKIDEVNKKIDANTKIIIEMIQK